MEENDLQNLSKSEPVAVSDLEKNSISIQAGDPSFKMVRFSLERESKGSRWTENVSRGQIKNISIIQVLQYFNIQYNVFHHIILKGPVQFVRQVLLDFLFSNKSL